jgi:hypothetical protein
VIPARHSWQHCRPQCDIGPPGGQSASPVIAQNIAAGRVASIQGIPGRVFFMHHRFHFGKYPCMPGILTATIKVNVVANSRYLRVSRQLHTSHPAPVAAVASTTTL